MKKAVCVLSMVMVLAMVAVGLAGELTETIKISPVNVANATGSATVENIELTGIVLKDHTFLDENGQNYHLGATQGNLPLLDMIGEKMKVKATVMETNGAVKSIAVSSYEIIK